jgi:hypothetical protein
MGVVKVKPFKYYVCLPNLEGDGWIHETPLTLEELPLLLDEYTVEKHEYEDLVLFPEECAQKVSITKVVTLARKVEIKK